MIWFNPDTITKAGLDPTSSPKTYDEFRAACRAVKQKAGMAGVVLPLKDPVNLRNHVGNWSNAAGFEGFGGAAQGPGGQLFKTGEIAYHSDPYVTVLEFLMSLKKDGLVMSASSELSGATARGRWASGGAAYEIDGPWVPGTIKVQFPAVANKIGWGTMLVPDTSFKPIAYTGPAPGIYFLSKTSKQADLANAALGLVASKEWQTGFASTMDQPPYDLAAVEKSKATDVYKSMVKMLEQSCFDRPLAIRRQPDIAKVDAEYKEPKPGLGDVVQRYLLGEDSDIRKSLKKLSDDTNKALDTAIADAKSKHGSKATREDYVFANWQPAKDYTKDMYNA